MNRNVRGWIAALTIITGGTIVVVADYGPGKYIAFVIGVAYGYAVCELVGSQVRGKK